MNKRIWALLMLSLSTACERSTASDTTATDASFSFSMLEEEALHVTVSSHGVSLPGAIVVLRGAELATTEIPNPEAQLLWQGATGADGTVSGRLSRKSYIESLDVVVVSRGYTGHYGDETKRAAYGPMAPAAWFTISPADLGALQIELQPMEAAK